MVALVTAAALMVSGPGRATPTSATTPAALSGEAFGISASGQQSLAPTPHVVLPPGGSAQLGTSARLSLGGLLEAGPFSVTTQAADYGGANETVDSLAKAQNVDFLEVTPRLTIQTASADCSAEGLSTRSQGGLLTGRNRGLTGSDARFTEYLVGRQQPWIFGWEVSIEVNARTVSKTPAGALALRECLDCQNQEQWRSRADRPRRLRAARPRMLVDSGEVSAV